MKEKINDYVKAKKKEAVIKFLKKHIVGEIVLLLIIIGIITLKVLKKTISFHLKLAIIDKADVVKNRKKADEDYSFDDDIESVADES